MSLVLKEVVVMKISNEAVVRSFWGYFDMGEFEEAAKLMKPEAVVQWFNTREIFRGRDKFILANQRYPGSWRINIEKLISLQDMVITVVEAESQEPAMSFYATTFFRLANSLICEIEEYWSENGEPPKWRIEEGLAERF